MYCMNRAWAALGKNSAVAAKGALDQRVIAEGVAEGGEQADLLLKRLKSTWKLRLQVWTGGRTSLGPSY